MKKLFKLHFVVALAFLTVSVITTTYFNVAQADAIAKAKAEWIEENGEWQPNLDADTEKYLRKTTALLQEQRNAKSKTR